MRCSGGDRVFPCGGGYVCAVPNRANWSRWFAGRKGVPVRQPITDIEEKIYFALLSCRDCRNSYQNSCPVNRRYATSRPPSVFHCGAGGCCHCHCCHRHCYFMTVHNPWPLNSSTAKNEAALPALSGTGNSGGILPRPSKTVGTLRPAPVQYKSGPHCT